MGWVVKRGSCEGTERRDLEKEGEGAAPAVRDTRMTAPPTLSELQFLPTCTVAALAERRQHLSLSPHSNLCSRAPCCMEVEAAFAVT